MNNSCSWVVRVIEHEDGSKRIDCCLTPPTKFYRDTNQSLTDDVFRPGVVAYCAEHDQRSGVCGHKDFVSITKDEYDVTVIMES